MNQPASRWSLPIVLVAAVLHLALWLLLMREVVVILPAYEHAYRKINTQGPGVTHLIVSLRGFAPAIGLLFPVVDGIVLIWLHRQRQLPRLLHWSLLLLTLLTLVLGGLELENQLVIFKIREVLSRFTPPIPFP
jgi:type II secretory pathway component PulF